MIVSRNAQIFIEEHHKKGILTAIKHFPGHGSSSKDSHESIADVELSWSPEELIPYKYLIGARLVDSIMVARAKSRVFGKPREISVSTRVRGGGRCPSRTCLRSKIPC
jgi:beta-N-acetylhexosaminidase